MINLPLNADLPVRVHSNLLDKSNSIILNFTASILILLYFNPTRQHKLCDEKSQDSGEWNAMHPQASTLGWDQVHVNTTLPRFIDAAAFCGILIGVAVIPRKT